MATLLERVSKYGRMLNDEERIEHAMTRLEKLPVTLEILKETGVGKMIGKLRSHERHGDRAKAMVERWKEMGNRDRDVAPIDQRSSPPSDHPVREKREKKRKGAGKRSSESQDVQIELKPKRLKPLPTLELEDMKPAAMISTNSSESTCFTSSFNPSFGQSYMELDGYDPGVFTRKTTNRLLGGRRHKMVTLVDGEVPRLFDMCMRTCINNIDAIEEIGGIPFDILRPVLEKCTEAQLGRMETRNPYLREDTDQLWEKHCQRLFPNSEPEQDEGWRECFERLSREQEERLKNLSQRINIASKANLGPQRKTKAVDPITPRAARQKQISNGIYSARDHRVPTAIEVSRARREMCDTGDTASFKQLPLAIRNTDMMGTTSRGSRSAPVLPKKAPLMAKVLKILKGQSRSKR